MSVAFDAHGDQGRIHGQQLREIARKVGEYGVATGSRYRKCRGGYLLQHVRRTGVGFILVHGGGVRGVLERHVGRGHCSRSRPL